MLVTYWSWSLTLNEYYHAFPTEENDNLQRIICQLQWKRFRIKSLNEKWAGCLVNLPAIFLFDSLCNYIEDSDQHSWPSLLPDEKYKKKRVEPMNNKHRQNSWPMWKFFFPFFLQCEMTKIQERAVHSQAKFNHNFSLF